MRRALWIALALALLFDLGLAALLASKIFYGSKYEEDLDKKLWLVQIRKALFSDFSNDAALLQASPEELAAHGFLTDSPEEIAAWARQAFPSVPYLRDLDPDTLPESTIERAQAIVLLFSKNGGGGGCGHFTDLQDNLEHIAEGDGQGCCADHAQAMIALGQALGLTVRQVGHGNHTFNEVWWSERRKWVFIDPQYALMARDDHGEYLGLFEMRERFRNDEPVAYVFFGNAYHEFMTGDPKIHPYYDGFAAFHDARYVWGSNVIAQDRIERGFGWMPKAARQLIGFTAGVFPPMKVYADGDAELPALFRTRRILIWSVAALAVFGPLVPAALLLATRRRTAAARALRPV